MVGAETSCAWHRRTPKKAKLKTKARIEFCRKLRRAGSINPTINVKAVCVFPSVAEAQMEMARENFGIDFVEPGFFLSGRSLVRHQTHHNCRPQGFAATGKIFQRLPIEFLEVGEAQPIESSVPVIVTGEEGREGACRRGGSALHERRAQCLAITGYKDHVFGDGK